jgi:hypothetical protein
LEVVGLRPLKVVRRQLQGLTVERPATEVTRFFGELGHDDLVSPRQGIAGNEAAPVYPGRSFLHSSLQERQAGLAKPLFSKYTQ